MSAQVHVVKQGETLLSIAHEHRFRSWETIWNHEDNQALRDKRPDPQVLAEGDEVHIPEKVTTPVEVVTNKRHTFVVKALRARFRTVVLDDRGKALANRRFVLEVGEESLSGFTNDQGVIELDIDPRPQTGKLQVFGEGTPPRVLTWNLKLGSLNPIELLSGVKARLTNLGFVCTPIDEELNDVTKRALRDFQIVHRLTVTGEPDDATRAHLLSIHDRR